jgi:hypothetical protein
LIDLAVARFRECLPKGHHAVGLKPWLHRAQLAKAANKQPGADKQD